MPADLEELLRTPDPAPTAPDVDALWQAGRRRRRRRLAATAVAGLGGTAAVVLGAVVLAAGQQVAVPEIEPLAPPTEVTSEEPPPAVEPDAAEDAAGPTGASEAARADVPDLSDGWALSAEETRVIAEAQRVARERAAIAARDARDAATAATPSDPTAEPDTTTSASSSQPAEGPTAPASSGPTPDPNRVAAPCAAHAGAAPSAFIDVVSPVAGQAVGATFELVGCASVYEGTVRYRVLDGGGRTIVDRFTTATAGGPELGEFRETVTVGGDGPLTLHVFWDSPADGEGERDLQVLRLGRG
jgi:hypothetical protein